MGKISRDAVVTKKAREKSICTKQEEIKAKHAAVVQAKMEGASDTDAMRAAGYHPSNALNVMRDEDVQTALAEARSQMSDISTIKRIDVMNIFMEAIEMARTLADPANMINGADKIAKVMGYYAPETKRIELTTDQNVFASKLRQLTDQELMDLAEGRLKTIDGESERLQ
ncbi:MAG: hypothetical protein IPL32_17715 [Chloracidobacterium sp.]|nr:hypothetical protein [Chloracidobacterium sp.]